MPVIPNSSSAGAFGLYVQGVNYTSRVAADSVRISEVGGESTASMEFDLRFTTGGSANLSWLGGLSHNIELKRLSDGRRLFYGNLVNVRRTHLPPAGAWLHCTALSYDAWLDRLILPKWISKRPNGTNMTTDREMIQNVISAAQSYNGFFFCDALNANIASTNASMPLVKVDGGGSVRDIISAIAEAAATVADPTARRFFIDFDQHLQYFKGSQATTAPYLIGDASYTDTIKGTSGLISLWPGYTGYDTKAYANATLNGGFTAASGLTPNEPQQRSITFNGTTGYASATGANLHQADGPWSVEFWIQRNATGSQQAVWSGGTNDILIGFDATDHIRVQKEGTGDHFVSTPAYTSTTTPYHIVVTRTGGAVTTVYVNGSSISGTTTGRTFASAAGAINIGRKLSTTDQFLSATVNHVAFYSAALSASTVLAHYNDGWTVVPDDFEFETDVNSSGTRVYVKGGNANGTGTVYVPGNSGYNQSAILDRPQSTSVALRNAIGTGYIKREMAVTHSFKASVTGFNGWRGGQTLTVDDNALGIPISGYTAWEIKQLDTFPNMGSGEITYDIYGGALPWSGNFDVQRKRRR